MAKIKVKKTDIFGAAPVANTAEVEAAKAEDVGDKLQITFGTELETLAAISTLQKALTVAYKAVEETVKGRVADEFASTGFATKRKPENFIAVSGPAHSGCELRRRASNRPLTTDEASYLENNGLELQTVVTGTPEQYFFNPKAIADRATREKVSAALAGITFSDGPLIMKQEAVETTTKIVKEDVLATAAAAAKSVADLKMMYGIVSTTALRPTFNGGLDRILNSIHKAGISL